MTLMYILAYLSIGLSIGWMSRITLKERGIKMIPSLLFGVFGALSSTLIITILAIPGTAFYAMVGAIGVLFIINVFRQESTILTTTKTNY